ncbi:MAG: amidase [Ilumatobacteraceae bacterium]
MAERSSAVESLTAFPFGSARQLARAVRSGAVSSVELLRGYLERVDRLNPAINAIVVDDRERALADAAAADEARAQGQPVGPLHGVPMTVKENFSIPGQPTTWGYPDAAGNIASEDAVVVARLRAAGAVIFGKTNIPIAMADFQSYNDVYGTTNNPWDTSRGAGGSSGGSAAALAAGLTGLEYGSDIGGSIRNPAAYNGVYGHKPTYGIVPKRGQGLGQPVGESPISVVGPLARSAEDLAVALKVTAGPDLEDGYRLALPAPPTSLAGLRVAVWLDQPDIAPVDDAVTGPIEEAAKALAAAGASVDFGARPAFDVGEAHAAYLQVLMATMSARDPEYDRLAARADELEPGDESPYARSLRNSTARHRDIVLANAAREGQRWAWRAFFQDHDVLLAPITVTPPFPHDHSQPLIARTMTVNGVAVPYFDQLFWAGLAISAHLPATAAPVGLTPDGLPVGVQIIGDAYRDRTTIWAAGQLARQIGGFTPPPGF